MVALRLVGVAHTSTNIRWYLTTVPRYALSARQVVQAYRLRWLVELLFRELKQNADIGRAFTGDANAVQALTYGAMLAHVWCAPSEFRPRSHEKFLSNSSGPSLACMSPAPSLEK